MNDFKGEIEVGKNYERDRMATRRFGAVASFLICLATILVSVVLDIPSLIVVVTLASVTVGTLTFEYLLQSVGWLYRLSRISTRFLIRRMVLLLVLFVAIIVGQVLLARVGGAGAAAAAAPAAFAVEFFLARERLARHEPPGAAGRSV